MSTFRVVQLTQEALKVQCKLDDYEEWGAPMLDMEQYQRKEAVQRSSTFSQRGSIFWALVDSQNVRDDADLVAGQTVLYCHCESHRFNCAVRHVSGEIEQGYSHHIGSVFTLPEHRKQGLATIFMKKVAEQLKQLSGAVVSVLYSDIGPTFYSRLGWKLHPSKMAAIDVANSFTTDVNGSSDTGMVSLYLDANLDKLLRSDNRRLLQLLKDEKYRGRDTFVVLPTRDSTEWQFCIGQHYARVRGYMELPSRCGVKINEDIFILWCHNVKESTLYILRARFPEAPTDAAISVQLLLDEALEEARKFSLTTVTSLSSAMLFCHRNAADSSEPLPYWLCNEKYSWV
ncbi:unnamed protein product [Hyaloperonospora brassicae]|uniref:LYC1 C-terminal domain-containing protein n=1 Tax=Hyaloperonospora brassicae TaxID=162125 RepID=A0AAV0TRW8_HYABA|nr:unnamed protein product [Hyaloperonospora brassicae]